MATIQQSVSGERDMLIVENTYREFVRRYGATAAADLVIFYTQVKQGPIEIVKFLYPTTTFYRYRNILIRDGYLTFQDFKGG